MLQKILAGTVLTITVASAVWLIGCRGRHFHGRFCGPPEKRAEMIVEKISDKLDLTDEQVSKLNKIKDDILVKGKVFKKMRTDMHAEAIVQIKSDKVDQIKLNQMLAQREVKMRELRPFIVKKFAEFHSMLTPEQRNKLVEKLEYFKRRCEK